MELGKAMYHFQQWNEMSEFTQQKYNLNKVNNTKLYLTHITYENLKISVCGFINYNGYVLEKEKNVHYVVSAHSNKASIKILFSITRRSNLDTSSLYKTGNNKITIQ